MTVKDKINSIMEVQAKNFLLKISVRPDFRRFSILMRRHFTSN